MTLTEEQRGQVEANMGLIGKVLKDKLRGSSALGVYTHEDLFQIGCVGLCKAVAEDKKTGCFSTFAYRLIWNEICDALVLGNRYAMHEAPTEDLSDTHPTANDFASSNSRLELEELQQSSRIHQQRNWGSAAAAGQCRAHACFPYTRVYPETPGIRGLC